MPSLLAEIASIGLDELDQRAALQRRIDRKYVVEPAVAEDLVDRLAASHQALEIDGRRWFRYESAYFDTPALACYRDQVAGRRPRYKVRSRLYADSDECSFELKLKLRDEQGTVKEHGPCAPEDHGRLVPAARRFVDETLRDAGLEPPDELEHTLTTRFRRGTLAARDGGERVTFDRDLEVERPSGPCVRLHEGLVIVETKSPDGEGDADRVLADAGVDEVSFSKFRAGIEVTR